jgi:hypothetical protein
MTTITATEAATQAGVTVDTIRTWCRRNVVGAIKASGRWVIDTASLTARIAIGAMKRPAPKPAPLTADAMLALGGRHWSKNGMDRIYLNNWAQFADLEVTHYKTGNVSSASFLGRRIANGRLGAIVGAISKVYFDVPTGRLMFQHHGADALDIRFYDGDRVTVDLMEIVARNIRTAAAAL